MVSAKTPIVIIGIVIALIIAIMLFTRFSLPNLSKIGKQTSDAFSDAGKGLQDFFNSFEVDQNKANSDSLRVEDPNDSFVKDIEPSRGTPQEVISRLDPTDPKFEQNKIDALNSFGITGADKVELLPNGGLKITQDGNPNNNPKPFENFNLPNPFNTPQAFADSQEEITVIDARLPDSRPLNLSSFAKIKPTSKKSNSIVKGTVRSLIDAPNTFQVFSSNGEKIEGTIRETKQDPRKLRTDSKKRPLETASERASRIFEETGRFADEGRFGVTSAKNKVSNFDFGSNTGNSLKLPTVNKTGQSFSSNLSARQRLELRKKQQALKSAKVFDSRSINNF